MTDFTVSASGLDLIKRNEGCSLHAYRDMVGVPTIGWGHIEGVKMGDVITQAQADQMLADDLNNNYGKAVNSLCGPYPTTQQQFDAMLSLSYNVGIGGLAGSTVMRQHRAGNYPAAAQAFSLWDKAGGHEVAALLRRRHEEADLYLSSGSTVPSSSMGDDPVVAAIKALQGLVGATVDGLLGANTIRAIQQYRASKGL